MTENTNDKSIWDEIYRKTNHSPGWERPGTDPNLLEMIRKLYFPREGDEKIALLDSGCGNGRNTPLAEKLHSHFGSPVSYLGVDFAESAVDFCRSSYPDNKYEIQDMCTGLEGTAVEASAPYDVIVDCGCFHAIPPELRESYMDNIASLSAPDGLLLLGAWYRTEERDGKDPHYFPFLYLSEWFFNDEDIRKFWSGRFSFLESRVDPSIYPGLHDGFAYFALRRSSDKSS